MSKLKNDKKIFGEGKWLVLEQLAYEDRGGSTRHWESVRRLKCGGAVLMRVLLRPSDELLLVRQFRPPAAGYVIEFPAGLVDESETSEAAAVRELREETGYSGRIVEVFPPSFTSPGLTSETVSVVVMEVDLGDSANKDARPDPDEGEDIEVIRVPRAELMTRLREFMSAGLLVDSKVMAYALAMSEKR